jgi:hypothetical protein
MSNTRKTTGARAAKAPPPPPPDLDTLLGEDTRAERVVPLCLRGHLLAEWDQLKELYDAGPGVDEKAMLTDRAAKRKVAEQMAAVEAQMRAGTVAFRLRALPRRRTPAVRKEQVVWLELLAAHPPRKDPAGKVDRRDAAVGVNVGTFFDALVRASVVEPELDDQRWEALDGKLTDGQFNQLANAAWQLNRAEVDVPFSRAASMTRALDAGSRRPSGLASPSDASTGGSPTPSPSTSTTSTGG